MKEKIIVLIAAIGMVLFLFPTIVFEPNDFMFGGEGDGLKNYFNAAFYIKNDSGFTFTGTQYPYGTNIVYTDNQPAISYILMQLNQILNIDLSDYTVGILNYAILISMVISIYMTYLILRFFRISFLFSLSFALLITVMSPQFCRISAHYALAYSFFVPVIWFILLNIKNKSAFYLFNVITLFNIFMGFLHPYYILIAAVFQLTYILIHFLYLKKELGTYKKKYIAIVSSVGTSIVVFQVILKLTDAVLDRPKSPWGLMEYRAVFEGIFLPVTGSLRSAIQPYFDNWFMEIFFDLNYQSFESDAYVGVLGLIFLFFILIRIIHLIRIGKKRRVIHPVLPFEIKVSIFCSLIVLLFSMAYPFRLSMEFLLEIIPPLKQFRSLGRFAWVFYHVFLVLMCYYIFLIYKVLKRKKEIYAYVFVVCVLSIWIFDSYEYVNGLNPAKVENCLNKNALNKYENSFNPKKYQCIFTLPLYIAGTEKIDKGASSELKQLAAIYGYKYNLPNISGELSRTSIAYGQNIRQMSSSLFIHRQILNDLNKDSILLIVRPNEINENHKKILGYAQFINKINEDEYVYRIAPGIFKMVRDSLINAANSAFSENMLEKNYISNSFDSIKGIDTENRFYGNGALVLDKSNDKSYKIFLPNLMCNKTVELSFWCKLNYNTSDAAQFEYTLFDSTGVMILSAQSWLGQNEDIDKGWILAKKLFVVPNSKANIIIKSNIDGTIIDELIIREVNTSVYTQVLNNKPGLFNNYLLNK